ncbi:MAG: general secretion pathway protein GspK [Pseudohongiellaceae bacterium]
MSRLSAKPVQQRGSVLLIVMWTAVLLTILVTAMASKVRLSARTAFNNQLAADDYTQMMSALHSAEMEILLERMSPPIDAPIETDSEGAILDRSLRFDGRPLRLSYPTPDDMVVRIINHSGMINLNRIPRASMQLLIEKRLQDITGEEADPEEVQNLLAAWTDWTDLNDLEGINGAERDYYESLDLPYLPRNNPELDSVNELLHVRGFAELFEGVDLESAFTIYGNNRQLNINVATREALSLLPGLTPALIDDLLAVRAVDSLTNRGEIGEVIPFENLTELSPWLSNETSDFYTLYVYRRPEPDPQSEEPDNSFNSTNARDRQRNASAFDPENYPRKMPLMNESRVGEGTEASSQSNAESLAQNAALRRAEDPWEIAPGIGRQALSAVVEFTGGDSPPRVYQINPYATLPKF